MLVAHVAKFQQFNCFVVEHGARVPATLHHIFTRHARERQRVRPVTRDMGRCERADFCALATGDFEQIK